MAKTLEEKVKELRERVGNNVFYYDDCNGITTIATLKKYNLIHKVNRDRKVSMSIEEVVDLLNMIDEDNEYFVEDDKVCYIEHEYGYQLN